MRSASPLRLPAVVLALLLPSCFQDGGLTSTGATGATGSTSSTSEASSTSDASSSTTAILPTTGDPTSPTTGSTSATSTTDSPTTDGVDTTTSSSSSTTTTTGALMCDDIDDAHDTELTATELPEKLCKTLASTREGILSGTADYDWYVFLGQYPGEGCINDTDPGLVVNAKILDGSAELCLFAECMDSDIMFTCPQGTAEMVTQSGLRGCCIQGSANSVKFAFNCDDVPDKDVRAYIRLQGLDNACLDYSFEYAFSQ